MDAVRTAKRLGAAEATLVYRHSRAEMPARLEEIHHAEEEGIKFLMLTSPVRIVTDESNIVRGMVLQTMELGEPDSSGRRRPVPVKGSELTIPVDTVIEAIGQQPNPIIQATTQGLDVKKNGVVITDESQKTSREGIFAGGDLSDRNSGNEGWKTGCRLYS
jgi:glutamate synthase (NADPH/NADH) small chain